MASERNPIEITAARLASGDKLAQRFQRLRRPGWTIMLGLLCLTAAVGAAVFAQYLAPHDPFDQDLSRALLPPMWLPGGSPHFPLGTDYVGRDVLSRVIFGSRVSLAVGLGGVGVASLLGMVLGLMAGYLGGWVDAFVTRAVDIVLAVPYVLFVVVMAAILGPSLANVILIFGIADFPVFARLVRGEALSLKESQFVEAAECTGAGPWWILWTHFLPNIIGTVITMGTFEMAAMVLWEAGLGFLGLSVSPIIPSWGNMMAEGREYLRTSWWLATFPGFAVALLALGINLTGDWLRFTLDPRSRGTN